MKTLLLLLCLMLFIQGCNGQKLASNEEAIEKAREEMRPLMDQFNEDLLTYDLDLCVATLVEKPQTPYQKFVVGGFLYEIDSKQSFRLHQEAYEANPKLLNFNLEYALELHRNHQYTEAAKIYEKYLGTETEDFRAHVWLADCYVNTGNYEEAIKNWTLARHPSNHTAIDKAIWTVYGRSDQLHKRNEYLKEIKSGNLKNAGNLIYLEVNWEADWWNSSIQKYLLEADMELLKSKLSERAYDILKTYWNVKRFEESSQAGSIKNLLQSHQLILDNNALPENGNIASDLLRICFQLNLLDEAEFYKKRGQELLALSQKTGDVEVLNIYAYLQATVNQKVDPKIDKMGWKDFKDERFAMSYLVGKGQIKANDPELAEALNDFPLSSGLKAIQLQCAIKEKLSLKPFLFPIIQCEFRTLRADSARYSYGLKAFFGMLAEEI